MYYIHIFNEIDGRSLAYKSANTALLKYLYAYWCILCNINVLIRWEGLGVILA